MSHDRQKKGRRSPARAKTGSGARSPVRAMGYLRVSTRGQAERGMGLTSQRERVTTYAHEKGYALLDVLDEAASGGVQRDEVFSWEHRPVLLDVLGRAQAREFDVLIVAKLDRLSRDHTTLVVLERQLQRHGVAVESVAEEKNGDGPLAEFIRGQLALVAQLERSMILERVGAGKAKRKAQGRHVHGRVPYGYRSESGVLSPVPELAPIVRRIFEGGKAGDSPGHIARALNADGVPAPQGPRWSEQGVRVILRNPAYAGERYGVKSAHEAMISRHMFNAAHAAVSKRAAEWRSSRRG
jgi:site-specific DNA recombinase